MRPSESLVSPEDESILEKRRVAVATAEPPTQSHILSRAMRDIYIESRHLQARGAVKAYQQAEEGKALKEKEQVNSSAATGMGDEIRCGNRNDEVTLPKVPDTQRTRRELRRTAMPKWAQNQLQAPDAPPPVFSANRQLNRSGENSLNSSFALLDAAPGGAATSPADPFEKSVSGGTQAAPILAEAKIRRVSRNSTPSSVEDPRSPRPAASLPSPNVPWQHNKKRLQTAAESPVLVVGDVSDVGAVAAPLARRQREHRQKKAALVAARERRMAHRPHSEQPSRFADSLSSVETVEGRTEKSDCKAPAASATHSGKKETQPATRARSKETKQQANASRSKSQTTADKNTAQRANRSTSADTSLASPRQSTTTAPYQGDRELLKSVAAAICDFFTADDNNNSGRTTAATATATVADARQVIAAMPPTRLEELFSLYQAHQVLCNRLHITSNEGLGSERYEAIQQWTTSVQPVVPPPPPLPLTNARAAATASGVPAALPTPPTLQEQQPLQLTASQRRAVLLQRTPKQSSKVNGTARPDGALTGATTAAGGGVATAATEPLSPSPKAAHKSGNASQRATRASATAAAPNTAASALPPLASPLKAGARDTHAPAASAVADTGPPPPAKQRGFVRLFSCSAPSTHSDLADKGEKRRKNPAVVPLHNGRAVPAARAAPPPPLSSSEFVPHCGLAYNCDEAVQLYALWERKEAQKLQQEIQRAKVKAAAATATATTKAPAPDTLLQESFNLLVRGHPSNRSLNSLALPGSSGSMSKTVLDLLHRTYGSSSSLSDTGLGQHSSFSLSIAERDISAESQMSSSLSQPLPPLTRGLSQGYLLFNSDSTSASHEESAKEQERVERRAGQPTLQERDVAEMGRVRAAPRGVSAASTPARAGPQGAVGSEASSADLFSDYFEASPSGSDAGSLQSSFTFYSRRDDSSSHHSDSSSVAAVEAMAHLYTMPTEVSWRKKA